MLCRPDASYKEILQERRASWKLRKDVADAFMEWVHSTIPLKDNLKSNANRTNWDTIFDRNRKEREDEIA